MKIDVKTQISVPINTYSIYKQTVTKMTEPKRTLLEGCQKNLKQGKS